MRAQLTALIVATVLAGCGEPRNLLAPATTAPNIRPASVQPQALMVQKLPEGGASLIGAFNLMNGNRSSETLRFFGTRQALTKVTMQNGASAQRAITPKEAASYAQLLAQARADQATSELRSLLGAWANKKGTSAASSRMAY